MMAFTWLVWEGVITWSTLEIDDCASDGSTPAEWALEDAIEAFKTAKPVTSLLSFVEASTPSGWRPKAWKKACVDYLVESYIWHRLEHADQLGDCEFIAVKETFEWGYCQVAPKVLKPMSVAYRGW